MARARETKTLGDLGGWTAVQVGDEQHRPIRHAFEQALTACARLASFSSGGHTRTEGPVNERQEMLAIADLIEFAIHARRLIELTRTQKRFSRVGVRSLRKRGELVPVYRIINMIMHHRRLEIIRHASLLRFLQSGKLEDLIERDGDEMSPLVSVESDKGRKASFHLEEFAETAQSKLLLPVVELCAEHQFFLEDL